MGRESGRISFTCVPAGPRGFGLTSHHHRAHARAHPGSTEADAAAAGPEPPRALLVDDEPVIRQALRRFFVRIGWEVDEAENGTEALRQLLGDDATALKPREYTVIISDLRMPGVSGMELHARIAEARPTCYAD